MRIISCNYHQEYDACVKIHNPEKFFKAASDSFKEYGNFKALDLCAYINRSIHHSKPNPDTHPVFIKEPKYKYQEEIRAVWSPNNIDKINSKILEVPELSKYCELYYVDEHNITDDLPRITEKNFKNDVIKIDSSFYHKCIFKNSNIIYCAEGKLSLSACEFHDCNWLFEGPAGETIGFMRDIYHHLDNGGKQIVNSIFKGIKKQTAANLIGLFVSVKIRIQESRNLDPRPRISRG